MAVASAGPYASLVVRVLPPLAMALCLSGCLSVCLSVSVTGRRSIETAERIELVFGMGASFQPSYSVLTGNSAHSKNKGTSLWNVVPNSGLRKFCFGISIVESIVDTF